MDTSVTHGGPATMVERRAGGPRAGVSPCAVALLAVVVTLMLAGCASGAGTQGATQSAAPAASSSASASAPASGPSPASSASAEAAVRPSAAAFAAAERWLRARAGVTALAVVDSRGRLRGYGQDKQFASASVVKAMLLVQYLRTHPRVSTHERFLLARMIVASDDAATDEIFAQVGSGGLGALARTAGMRRFTPAAEWALSGVTAADQARFFSDIDRFVPGRHRALLDRLLSERGRYRGWGIPQAALTHGWRVWWKDGWMHSASGELLLQVARLERDGIGFAVAVIADGQPSSAYGVATMRGVGERLLR